MPRIEVLSWWIQCNNKKEGFHKDNSLHRLWVIRDGWDVVEDPLIILHIPPPGSNDYFNILRAYFISKARWKSGGSVVQARASDFGSGGNAKTALGSGEMADNNTQTVYVNEVAKRWLAV